MPSSSTDVYKDEVVYIDNKYCIIKSDRLFGTGFNVYVEKSQNKDGTSNFEKMNGYMSCFGTYEAAKDWLDNNRRCLS